MNTTQISYYFTDNTAIVYELDDYVNKAYLNYLTVFSSWF